MIRTVVLCVQPLNDKVRTPGEIYGLMERGGQLRATGATRMNDTSSRSHAVFIIIVEQVGCMLATCTEAFTLTPGERFLPACVG